MAEAAKKAKKKAGSSKSKSKKSSQKKQSLGTPSSIAAEVGESRPKRRKKRKTWPEGQQTKIAKDVRAGTRRKPPVPKGKSLEEIQEMDDSDPEFRHPQGRPRSTLDKPKEESTWADSAKKDKQRRAAKRRAKVRKHEAVVIKATQERGIKKVSRHVHTEDQLVAEGVIDLTEWDNAELRRGYRRNRSGKFGTKPKYIPREVHESCFRELVTRGNQGMRSDYMLVTSELRKMIQDGDIPPKVRLDAMKEYFNRTVGKVPDNLHVQTDAPWQDMLADEIQPYEIVEVEQVTDRFEEYELEGEGESPDAGRFAAAEPALPAPSPSPKVGNGQMQPDGVVLDGELVE